MGTQKQPKDSFWYNNRFVLILLFVALYIIVPALLLILGNRQWSYSYFLHDKGYNLAILLYLVIIVVVYPWCIISVINGEAKENARVKLLENIINGRVNSSKIDVDTRGSSWFRRVIHKVKIYFSNLWKALKGVGVNQNHKMINAIEDYLSKSSAGNLNGIVENATKDAFEKVIQTNISDCFKESKVTIKVNGNEETVSIKDGLAKIAQIVIDSNTVQKGISTAIDVDTIKGTFENVIKQVLPKIDVTEEMMKEVLREAVVDKEKEWKDLTDKKYRFVERIVEDICKKEKPQGAVDIYAFKDLIGSILNNDFKGCCVTNMNENGNMVTFTLIDANGEQYAFTFDNKKKKITSDNDCELALNNGYKITIKKGAIESIKKS